MRLAVVCLLLVGSCGDDEQRADTVEVDGVDAVDALDTLDAADGVEVDGGDAARWDRAATPWPMFGGDPQRSGRSPFVGPTTYTPDAPENWTYAAEGGASINLQPTITAGGVYFGTWGIDRGAATADPATSDKSDGRYYGLDAGGSELFPPLEPARLAGCYSHPDEPPSATDTTWCGDASALHVTFYNGTIEGTGLVDPWNGRHYVGRGDGRLYAVDPIAGVVVWSFATFDPQREDHPDGGGEIVAGALMGPDGTIYFATFGIPWPGDASSPRRETQAVYAVDRDGHLRWRYPSQASSLDNTVTAGVALSPDGGTLYVGTWLSDTSVPGRLLALDLAAGPAVSDDERLKWSLALENAARLGHPKLWVRHLSVGSDGTIFVAGAESRLFGYAAAVVAVEDQGTAAAIRWLAEPDGYADATTTLVQGLALGDAVFATTGDARDYNGREGGLAAIDARTGEVLGRFDPGDDAPGSATGPLLDAAGHVYFGTRGRHDLFAEPWAGTSQWRRGVMLAVAWNAGARTFTELWRKRIDALLDWATPALDAAGVLYFGSTAPLRTHTPTDIWEPLVGTPPRTTCWLFAVAK